MSEVKSREHKPLPGIEYSEILIFDEDNLGTGIFTTVLEPSAMSKINPILNIPDGSNEYILNTDRLRLRQILLNLLNNAIKFTPEGYIEFGYFVEEFNQNLVFYVKDTGIGIAFVKLDKIFERFTKVADISTKHYRGTGLGLSISLKLARLLNGDIKVESEVNKGTIFYVSFPYHSSFRSSSAPIAPFTDRLTKSLRVNSFFDVSFFFIG